MSPNGGVSRKKPLRDARGGPASGAGAVEAYGQNLRGGWDISRADVAHHMLRVPEQPETIKQVIGIAN